MSIPYSEDNHKKKQSDAPAGARGAIGLRGAPGTPGLTGERGIPGQDGERGIPGQDGVRGEKGEPGLQGVPGTMSTDGTSSINAVNITTNNIVSSNISGNTITAQSTISTQNLSTTNISSTNICTTNMTAVGEITGNLIGDVSGNLTGNVSGDLIGNVTSECMTTEDLKSNTLTTKCINNEGTINTSAVSAKSGQFSSFECENMSSSSATNSGLLLTQTLTADIVQATEKITCPLIDTESLTSKNLECESFKTEDIIATSVECRDILAKYITADITGNLTGNVTGNLTGDLIAESVEANDIIVKNKMTTSTINNTGIINSSGFTAKTGIFYTSVVTELQSTTANITGTLTTEKLNATDINVTGTFTAPNICADKMTPRLKAEMVSLGNIAVKELEQKVLTLEQIIKDLKINVDFLCDLKK